MSGRKGQVCTVCGRLKAGHPQPFGKSCKLTPLSEEERALVLEEAKRLETVKSKDSIESVSSDKGKSKDKDNEDDVSEEEVFTDADDDDDDEEINQKMKQLELEQKKLLEQQKATKKALKKKRLMVKKKDKLKKLEKMQAELDKLKASVEKDQAELIALDDEPEPEEPDTPSTTDPPVFRIPAPVKPTAPARGNRGVLDPSNQVYAQGLAEQQGAQPARQPAAQPGVTAAQLFADNPYLAAACGFGQAAGGTTPKQHTDGKSSAENFMYKTKAVDLEENAPTYYEFIHGAFRLLLLRLTEDNKPIADRLKYYEQLSSYATKYKWSAVYKLHKLTLEDIKNDLTDWDKPFDQALKDRCFSNDAVVPDRSVRGGRARDGVRSHSERRRTRDNSWDRSEDWGYAGSVDRGRGRPRAKPCGQFNSQLRGCDWGGSCKFDHVCSVCYDRNRMTRGHPAYMCGTANQDQAPTTGSAQAGGGHR